MKKRIANLLKKEQARINSKLADLPKIERKEAMIEAKAIVDELKENGTIEAFLKVSEANNFGVTDTVEYIKGAKDAADKSSYKPFVNMPEAREEADIRDIQGYNFDRF